MANNRLWAVCKFDNECSCLSKSYGYWGGGFHCDDEFFTKHQNCPGNRGGGENIAWCDENDDRVIRYDFINAFNNETRIYFKGDEAKIADL
jgi:hypothetical protein